MLFLPALFTMLFLPALFSMLVVMLFLPTLFSIFLAVQLVYLAVQIVQPVEHIVEAVMHFLDGFCYGVFNAFNSFHRRLYNAFLELFYRIVFGHGTIIAWIS
jgi:nitrogen fixation/metabolism regulation signal transduction histidine kinase